MFFNTDFIYSCLKKIGFKKIEIIEREPYPGVEYESRRAYVFAKKTKLTIIALTRLMQSTQKNARLISNDGAPLRGTPSGVR
jgi:hypothetical protein